MARYHSDFARRYYYDGYVDALARSLATQHAANMAKAIFMVLRDRGVRISQEAETRISECSDRNQLETWLAYAASVETADDLFD